MTLFAGERPPGGPLVQRDRRLGQAELHPQRGRRSRPPRGAAIDENYQQRLESLLAVDEAVVGMVDALRAERELDHTLILFTSDNGFFHGEHRVRTARCSSTSPRSACR